MRVFLTGATGYLGTALARQLRADGHTVTAVVRPQSPAEMLTEIGVVTYRGDVTDRFSLREPMSGADWVVHMAAELDPAAPRERMWKINVEGSEAVASLAHKLGVGRFLSVSSVAYFGGSPPDGSLATEETPPQRPFPSAYSETKHEGERAIREWAKRGLDVTTVYPALIYGPPGKKRGSNSFLGAFARGRFPVLVGADRKTSWVHIDDVVSAMAAILAGRGVAGAEGAKRAGGAAYLLAGEVVTVRELAARIAEHTGVKAPRFDLPIPLARFGVALSNPLFRLVGRKPPLPAGQLTSLTRHWAFDDARARRELGWTPRSLAEGLGPTLDYLTRPTSPA